MSARRIPAGIGALFLMVVTPTLVVAQGTAVSPTPQAPGRSLSENRLFLRFIEDAALVSSYRLEGSAGFQGGQPPYDTSTSLSDEADLLGASGVFAMNVAEDFEFGARLGILRRDPERTSAGTGLTDLEMWGKLSVVSDPVLIALGVQVTAPTGNADKFLGTGETNVGFFGALRKDFAHVTLAGNVGLRINQDPDFAGLVLDGENSLQFGAAALFPAGKDLVLCAEWAFESERYDGVGSDSRLLGGIDYRQSQGLIWRGSIATGISDGAPDIELRAGLAWVF